MDCVDKEKYIEIVYFSGTGGTARVVDYMEQSLINRKCGVHRNSLDKSKSTEVLSADLHDKPSDILIVIYPVHAFDAPEPVYDWINKLPQGNGLPAAVVSVSGGGEVWPNTASRVGCIKALERKGYKVFYERMLVMPSNIFIDTNDHLAMHLLKCLPVKAEHCISEVLSGTSHRKKAPTSARIVSAIFKLEKSGAKWFGKKLSATDACNACGWCERSCPRKNIQMVDGRPNFGGQCIACLRCFYGCPKSAIQPSAFRFFAVKKGYDLDKLEERMTGIELEPVEKLAKGVFASLLNYLQHEEV
ncbi:MAG: EFR1 family ferrodoxin [Clostridia bacterium]